MQKRAGASWSAAFLRAADKSRAAVERDEEGMGRSQPPSCREGLSWLSAVIVEKGPTIDQPAFGPPVPHFAHTCHAYCFEVQWSCLPQMGELGEHGEPDEEVLVM
jgi:hypothetical protein